MFEKTIEKIVKKTIQAMGDGRRDEILIESFLTGMPLSAAGTSRDYRSYSAQVQAIYRKYKGEDEIGCWQTRAAVDTRTAFISGEGLSVSTTDKDLAKWIDSFLRFNKLKGSRFYDYVKAGEMEGNALLYLSPAPDKKNIRILRQRPAACGGSDFRIELKDKNDIESIEKIFIKQAGGETPLTAEKFKYIVLGGVGDLVNTSTRVGVVLHEIDNYDRCLNNMRANNHLFARPTPFFETEKQSDAVSLLQQIQALGWKIGSAFAGAAKFKIEVPGVGAMENIKTELAALAKAISATTGIPIHWLGHVDMMSNRSTAESLYETINNATVQERSIWAEAFTDLIIQAQEMAIDAGMLTGTVKDNFEVRIPLIEFSKMLDLVRALSLAFQDGAISIEDYRNALPGIDPYQTARAIEAAADATIQDFKADMPPLEDKNGTTPKNTPGNGE